jgi:altronate dehydratase
VDCWMGSYSIFAGYAAAGSNLVMFQLGGGGLTGRELMEGCPAIVAPFLWCTANPKTYQMAKDNIDFYSGTVITDGEDPQEAGERLYRTVIDIASGTLSRSETLLHTDPIDLCLEEPRF